MNTRNEEPVQIVAWPIFAKRHELNAQRRRHCEITPFSQPFPGVSLTAVLLSYRCILRELFFPFQGSQLGEFPLRLKKLTPVPFQRMKRISPFQEPVRHVQSIVLTAVEYSSVPNFSLLSQNDAKTLHMRIRFCSGMSKNGTHLTYMQFVVHNQLLWL